MKPLDQLHALFDSSTRQMGYTEHHRDNGRPSIVTQKTAGTAATFSLRELQTAVRAPADGPALPVNEHRAGELVPVSAALMERSRVAQAGARIVVVDPAAEARPVGQGTGVLGFQYTKAQFITVDAAPFALVPEPAPEVPLSAAPVSRIRVGSNGSTSESFGGPSYAVRFKLGRLQQKDVPADQLLQELLLSITMGLARVADHALLSAIVAATPAAFSLAGAAAAGLEFRQLRALVGTNGAAAAVGQDGTLRAAGIPAELTPAMAPTVVGSFASAGVAVHDSLRIVIERTNAASDSFVTCWADMQALLPDDSFFWVAA